MENEVQNNVAEPTATQNTNVSPEEKKGLSIASMILGIVSIVVCAQTEKDIASRYEQMNKNERVPQSVLDQWQKEQEKKQKRKNYGSNRNGIE